MQRIIRGASNFCPGRASHHYMQTIVLDWVLMIGCVLGGLLLAGMIVVAAGVWFGGHNT